MLGTPRSQANAASNRSVVQPWDSGREELLPPFGRRRKRIKVKDLQRLVRNIFNSGLRANARSPPQIPPQSSHLQVGSPSSPTRSQPLGQTTTNRARRSPMP